MRKSIRFCSFLPLGVNSDKTRRVALQLIGYSFFKLRKYEEVKEISLTFSGENEFESWDTECLVSHKGQEIYYNEIRKHWTNIFLLQEDASIPREEYYRELIYNYNELGMFNNVIESYKKLLEIIPDDAEAWYLLGLMY